MLTFAGSDATLEVTGATCHRSDVYHRTPTAWLLAPITAQLSSIHPNQISTVMVPATPAMRAAGNHDAYLSPIGINFEENLNIDEIAGQKGASAERGDSYRNKQFECVFG